MAAWGSCVPLAVAVFLLALSTATSSDPDPLQDFCVPEPGHPAGTARCKDPARATAHDFVFSGIRSPGNFSAGTGLAAVPVGAAAFPGLNTLGMSFVRVDLAPGGINPPHYHPRATELALVVKGRVYAGFVDSGNRVFARVLQQGEVAVFPRGLLHFQMNVGGSPATIFGSFNSQNPGLVRVPGALFGSGIREELLEKAFGLGRDELDRLRKRFGGPPKAV